MGPPAGGVVGGPGVTAWVRWRTARWRARPDDQIKRHCVPRRGRPEDVAALVAFLAGPSASFITGQSVHVDGAGCRTETVDRQGDRHDRTSPRRPRHR
ncbi:SDR family oxidoreductase [Streptomyces sp. NPDC050509]|uniref:SDR family oxidoreductase n=1 Tax=Streptomyces sp. NPDC050509 TaxID=3365620 RepID=UPI0037B9176C